MEVTVISTPPHMIFLNINFVNKISEKSKSRILVKQIKYSFFELEHIDNDEIQLKSTPIEPIISTRSTTMSKSLELQRLTESIETMRTSILQAYVSKNVEIIL